MAGHNLAARQGMRWQLGANDCGCSEWVWHITATEYLVAEKGTGSALTKSALCPGLRPEGLELASPQENMWV